MRRLVFPPSAAFAPAAVCDETNAINERIVTTLSAGPDMWSFTPAEIRDRRRRGLGPFPQSPKSDRARVVEIEGPGGPIALRVIAPEQPSGVYLHIHGGGWTIGASDEQDGRLERIIQGCNMAVVSVEYRLAPENPHPAGPDDCEAAALWLTRHAQQRFGTGRLTIGGESAGANLCVVTLLRLRDRHGLTPFRAANLVAGSYDLRLTPSAANWGEEKLVLNTRDLRMFARCYVPEGTRLDDPDVSPIFADLAGLPPALFSVGTRDILLDDTLMMASRWAGSGNETELAVFPGGAHMFMNFPSRLAEDYFARANGFLGAV